MKNKSTFISIIVLGVLLRMLYLLYTPPCVSTDVSLWRLMDDHIIEDGQFPVWEYGSVSVGVFFSYISALCALLFGAGMLNILIVELAFSVLLIIMAYFLGRELFNETGGLISAFLAAMPSFILSKTIMFPAGVYNNLLVFGSILFLLTLKIYKNDNVKSYILFGLIAGISFWIHFYSICFLVPCLFFVILNSKLKKFYSSAVRIIIFFAAFVISSFPLWWFNFRHNFATFKSITLRPIEEMQVHDVRDIIFLQLQQMLDIKSILSVSALLGAFYFFSFIYVFYKLRGELFKSKKMLIVIFVLFGVAIMVRAAVIPSMDLHPSIILYLGFLYLTVYFLLEMKKRSMALFLISLSSVVILGIMQCGLDLVYARNNNSLKNKYLYELMDELKQKDIHFVYTVEKLAPVINFLSKGVKAAAYNCRSEPDYTDIVDGSFRPAVCLPLRESMIFEKNLKYVCTYFKRAVFKKYVLFYSFIKTKMMQEEVMPLDWKAATNCNNEDASSAFDRDVTTRWTTNLRQEPGMFFMLDFGKEIPIDKIVLYYGEYKNDRLLSLEITGSSDNRYWKQLVYMPDNSNMLFWSGPHLFFKNYADRQEYHFNPVRVRYVRFSQPGFKCKTDNCWSINEIYFYSPISEKQEAANYDVDELDRYIAEKGFKDVYSDYWVSKNIKNIECRVNGRIDLSKNPVIVADITNDFDGVLENYGINFKKEIVGGFSVYSGLKLKRIEVNAIDKNIYSGSASLNTQDVEKAFDSILSTRWTTDMLQKPGHCFQVDLKKERYVSGIRLLYESSPSDFPRTVRIEILNMNNKWQLVKHKKDLIDNLFWNGFSLIIDNSRITAYVFEPIKAKAVRCTLESKSDSHYWSIHEIELLERVAE